MRSPRHDWNLHPYYELPLTFVAYGIVADNLKYGRVSYRCDPDDGAPWDKCTLLATESIWMVPLGYWD